MLFNKIQVRCASVLAALPPSPHSSSHCVHQMQTSIITPAPLPITAASNNAFNPNYIPKNTKERLALNDLYKVLDNSKSMCKIIQNKYLIRQEEADVNEEAALDELLDEQYRMIQMIKKMKNKLRRSNTTAAALKRQRAWTGRANQLSHLIHFCIHFFKPICT